MVQSCIQTCSLATIAFPTSSLTLYQNGVYYTGIKIFNKLPPELKELVQAPKILTVP
jgi:hypothetical protein